MEIPPFWSRIILAVAAIVIVSVGLNVYLLTRLINLEERLDESDVQIAILKEQDKLFDERLQKLKEDINRANAIGANVNNIVAQIDSMNKKIEEYVKNPVTIITDIGSGISEASSGFLSTWSEWKDGLLEKYPQLGFLFKSDSPPEEGS